MDVIRLIASDLDATLLDGQSQLPPDFTETVRALAERGIRFAAASGRPIYTLEEMFAPLQDDIILVGDNGGAICWKGESLYLSEMDAADWHTLAGQARSAGPAAVLCCFRSSLHKVTFCSVRLRSTFAAENLRLLCRILPRPVMPEIWKYQL